MQSECSVCKVYCSDAKGFLSNFGVKTQLSKIPLLNVLF